jgi:hypothetical protein
MTLIITRDELKQLKIQADEEKRRVEEEKRIAEIETAIQVIYKHVIRSAKALDLTKCLVAIGTEGRAVQPQCYGDFFKTVSPLLLHLVRIPGFMIPNDSMPFVISGLQEQFPDSKVSLIAPARDGKMYEVSSTESPFIQPHTLKAIVVDWS